MVQGISSIPLSEHLDEDSDSLCPPGVGQRDKADPEAGRHAVLQQADGQTDKPKVGFFET